VASRAALLAKLSRPRLHDVLARRRLFGLLDRARARPILWLAAQPGAGKTTLIAGYLEARRLPGIWYQVDAGDGDPATFFYYLGLAAKHLAPRKPPLPLLTPEYVPDLSGFARRYFRSLFARLRGPNTLVLDNFQELPEDSALHAVMVEALAEIPDGVNVIVASRLPPPAAYSRFIANKSLELVDWSALKLTIEEARAIVFASGPFSELEAQALYERSGGWAAGLTLLLERLKRGCRIDDIGEPEELQEVFNYFADQILNQASPENQHVLLHVCFLPRLTDGLAEQVSGSAQAGKLLDYLFRRHLFTDRRTAETQPGATARPPERDWIDARASRPYTYEFHALFRGFLQHKARETYSPKKLAEIAQHSARLLETNGHHQDALALYAQTGDWDAASALILGVAEHLLAKGRWETLKDWIGTLPTERVRRSSALLYWSGCAWAAIDPARARADWERARSLFEIEGDRIGQLLAITGIVRSHYLEAFSLRDIQPWIASYERLLGEHDSYSSPGEELAVYSGFQLAVMFTAPEHPMIHPGALRILELMDAESIDANEKVSAAIYELWYFTLTGNCDLGMRLIHKVDAFIDFAEVSQINRASWLVNRGFEYACLGQYEEAQTCYARAEAIARENDFGQVEYMSYQFRVYLFCYWGQTVEAERMLKRMSEMLDPGRPLNVGNFHQGWAMLYGARGASGDAQEGARHAQLAIDAIWPTGAPFFLICWAAMLANAFSVAGQSDRALSLIQAARQVREGSCYQCYDALLLMDEAYAMQQRGEVAECHRLLREALELARRDPGQSYYLHWMTVGYGTLLAEALATGIEAEIARALIQRYRVRAPRPHLEEWPWPVRIRTLGEFAVLCDDEPVAFSRKAPKRLIGLLKAIIAFGCERVPEEKLIDTLWPDMEADAAHQALGVAVRRLRDLLGSQASLVQQGGQVSLNLRICWVDAAAFEYWLDQAGRDCRAVAKALDLYRGNFLSEEPNTSWLFATRDRLHRKFLQHALAVGTHYEAQADWAAATRVYLRSLDADGVSESLYQGLIRCQLRLGRRAEALTLYRRMKQTLSTSLGISPSVASEALYRELTSG